MGRENENYAKEYGKIPVMIIIYDFHQRYCILSLIRNSNGSKLV